MPKQTTSPLKPNPTNKIRYDSIFFPNEWKSNFNFCFFYEITDKHGQWTKNLDLYYELYVEENRLLYGADIGLYNYYASLANRGLRLSQEQVAVNFGESAKSIIERVDRLQNCVLAHRVCRQDLHGTGHDIIIHSPPTRDDFYKQSYLEIIKQRLEMNFAKSLRDAQMSDQVCKNGQTRKYAPRGSCCPDYLQIDMREVRALVNEKETRLERIDSDDPEEARRKILRSFGKTDQLSEKFIRVVLDALKVFKRSWVNTYTYKENQDEFKAILANFCNHDKVKIPMHLEKRWYAAFLLANHYAPNFFKRVAI